MHIGFLFNHRAHQVYHCASVAFDISFRYPNVNVTIIAGNEESFAVLTKLAARYPQQNSHIIKTHIPIFLKSFNNLLKMWVSFEKPVVRFMNRKLFQTLDALVVPEYTSASLRRKKSLNKMKLISIPHGAGDRERSFDKRIKQFDLLLLPGNKTRDRLKERGILPDKDHYEIIGYPKFDLTMQTPVQKLFDNDKPIILYNPHFSPSLSSWPIWGADILDYFYKSEKYNLIFAPHVILFERHMRYHGRLPKRFHHCPNILIDTGSEKTMDMTYTRSADLYMGDVSSQVYEFLIQPRPCIFLNAHGKNWHDDPYYYFWNLGQVVNNLDNLENALDSAWHSHKKYIKEQRSAFNYTYSFEEANPSQRAADAIVHFLDNEGIKAEPENAVFS